MWIGEKVKDAVEEGSARSIVLVEPQGLVWCFLKNTDSVLLYSEDYLELAPSEEVVAMTNVETKKSNKAWVRDSYNQDFWMENQMEDVMIDCIMVF